MVGGAYTDVSSINRGIVAFKLLKLRQVKNIKLV